MFLAERYSVCLSIGLPIPIAHIQKHKLESEQRFIYRDLFETNHKKTHKLKRNADKVVSAVSNCLKSFGASILFTANIILSRFDHSVMCVFLLGFYPLIIRKLSEYLACVCTFCV